MVADSRIGDCAETKIVLDLDMLPRKNTDWSVLWDYIDVAPLHVWRGVPLLKPDASRLMWRIYQRTTSLGSTGMRRGLVVERERLVDHDVIWLKKIGGPDV